MHICLQFYLGEIRMREFIDKNALFEIVMDVRDGLIPNKQGLKKIFNLLLSLHGRVGVVDGEVIYNPDRYAYLSYVEKSSSIIKMPEGDGSGISRSMRIAILEDAQEWEIRVGEQICSQINEALQPYPCEDRMLLLEQSINGMSVSAIAEKYAVSKSSVHRKVKQLRGGIIKSFNLVPRDQEELYLRSISEYLEKSKSSGFRKRCQEKIELSFEIIEWEKTL